MIDPGAAVPTQLELRVLRSVHEVAAADWDAVTGADPDGTPFHQHAFLATFEDTGCVGAGTGWRPLFVTVWTDGGTLVGVAPAFVKAHSMGEFVYDFAWAEAATRAGIAYYPKLVVAAPFTPVTGRRLFARAAEGAPSPERIRGALLDGLVAVAEDAGLSGVHVLFALEDELALARARGFAVRRGCQFHWRNDGYPDFEAFLARFPSKRRNQIRRERRQVRESGVRIQHLHGEAIDEALKGPAFAFYAATVDRYVYGRRYLNEAFFGRLFTTLRPHLQLTLAWKGGEIVGGALNLEHAGRRFGRYWGALEDVPALHFEVCAYAGIEDCIARGIATFEAGAGGEAHKLKRGFLPTRTGSAHLVLQPDFQAAVEDFCGREAMALDAAMTEMARDSPMEPPRPGRRLPAPRDGPLRRDRAAVVRARGLRPGGTGGALWRHDRDARARPRPDPGRGPGQPAHPPAERPLDRARVAARGPRRPDLLVGLRGAEPQDPPRSPRRRRPRRVLTDGHPGERSV